MASKRYKKLPEKTKDLNAESIEKLLPELKKNCTTKFDESLDLSFQINNKQKKGEVNIRTVVNLPGGTGKKVKVAVVCEDNKAQEAKDAGADIVGGDEFVEQIKSGDLNFEKLICTPGMMIKLSKLGKVLGPKGLMPNPKLGSVSENIKQACLIFSDTEPSFGFGINPFGPKTFPNFESLIIIPGVQINFSKFKSPLLICSTNSSPPTISAPASFASCALLSSQTTATFTFLPVPPGRFTTVLMLTSPFFCLLFIWKLKSKDSSNFVVQFFLSSGNNFSIDSAFKSLVFSGNFLYLFEAIILSPLYPLI